jgi:hypothetical protein
MRGGGYERGQYEEGMGMRVGFEAFWWGLVGSVGLGEVCEVCGV